MRQATFVAGELTKILVETGIRSSSSADTAMNRFLQDRRRFDGQSVTYDVVAAVLHAAGGVLLDSHLSGGGLPVL